MQARFIGKEGNTLASEWGQAHGWMRSHCKILGGREIEHFRLPLVDIGAELPNHPSSGAV